MTLWLLGCVPPSVIGLRTDGTMPLNSELSVGWGAFPSVAEDTEEPLGKYQVAGLQARQRLSNRVGFAASMGLLPAYIEQGVAGTADAELQVQLLEREPVDLQVSVGIDTYMQGTWDDGFGGGFTAGLHSGLVLSRQLPADLHPFIGTKLNPVFPGGTPTPWLQVGGGLSWRPPIDDATRGLLHLEATHYTGFGAFTYGVERPVDIETWGFLVLAGASFGPTHGP